MKHVPKLFLLNLVKKLQQLYDAISRIIIIIIIFCSEFVSGQYFELNVIIEIENYQYEKLR